jgi:hypothetical protein
VKEKVKNPEIPCCEALNVPSERAEGFSWNVKVKVQHGGLNVQQNFFILIFDLNKSGRGFRTKPGSGSGFH